METTKRKGREKGFTHSEETKRLMSEAHTGMKFTAEHRKNISIAKKNGPNIWRGTQGPMGGKKHSEEARQKIGQAHSGKILSEETKDKIRQHVLAQPKIHCPHCHAMTSPPMHARWHGENCRHKI